MMANVDAHLLDDGRWGLGMVLRGEDGRVVGAATKAQIGSGNVELAETTGLLEALNLVESLQLESVIIEMDAATIVRAIHNKSFPRNHWGRLAHRCSRVFDANDNISLSWISRKGNEAAHASARWAIREPNKYWATNFPLCISQHIQKDMPLVT
jgi:ribonuclease HI